MTYSIAIRTLGTAGDVFKRELCSIAAQTIIPEKVIVYIAEGYDRPDFVVGKEEYVWVHKGMMAQRILPYDEITSDCILMLDDDVYLSPDSAERLLKTMEEHNADCVGADVFKNQEMPLSRKVLAAISNMVFPHWEAKWAFKMHRNGSFSYNNHPSRSFYWSQTCGGPAMMWKKEAFVRQHFQDELWLERLGFPYGEDALMTYRLHSNGGRLGILYDSGIENLDAQAASAAFRKSPEWMYKRTKASFMVWWRTCYRNGRDSYFSRFLAVFAYGIKCLWLMPSVCFSALICRKRRWLPDYFKGIVDGYSVCRNETFKLLPPYVFQ